MTKVNMSMSDMITKRSSANADPIYLGGEEFHTLEAIRARAKALLHGSTLGQRVEGQDARFVAALFKRHPDYVLKSGPGIVRYEVRPSHKGARCFVAIQIGGMSVPFGIDKCVTGRATPHQTEVKEAFRAVVDPYIEQKRGELIAAFTDKNGQIECGFTRLPISPDKLHMDHVAPRTFLRIVEYFLAREGLSLTT